MARSVDSQVDFIEKMLFSEPSWQDNREWNANAIAQRMQLDNGIIKQMIFTQPYYRKALHKIRTEVEELRASTKTKRKGAKPNPSIFHRRRGEYSSKDFTLGWPSRRKLLVEWFGASLNDQKVFEKVKEIDEQLSLIKGDAYVQYFFNDKQGIDNYTYLTSQWQPSEEEEEEHKFYKFLCTNFFHAEFLRDKPDDYLMIMPTLKLLEEFTRPLLRAKARNLYLRMRETLKEALSRTEAPPVQQPTRVLQFVPFFVLDENGEIAAVPIGPGEYVNVVRGLEDDPDDDEDDWQRPGGVRSFFGRTLGYDDVFAKAEGYAKETRALLAKANRQMYAYQYKREVPYVLHVFGPSTGRLESNCLTKFVRDWLIPYTLNQAEREKKRRLVGSLCTPSFLRRVRGLLLQLDEIMENGHNYFRSQKPVSDRRKTQANDINPCFLLYLRSALNNPKMWLSIQHFGDTSKEVREIIDQL